MNGIYKPHIPRILMECPDCGATGISMRRWRDPEDAVLVKALCPYCADGITRAVYFDKNGDEIKEK